MVPVVGKRLEARRKEKKLSQAELAAQTNGAVSQSALSRLESGKQKSLDEDEVRALALALDTSLGFLTGAEADPGPAAEPARLALVEDAVSPLEAALGAAFDSTRHTVRDIAAVQVALRAFHRRETTEGDLVEAARVWLDAAADLRRRAELVTLEALLYRVTVGKPSPHKARVAAERDAALNTEAARRARDAGLVGDDEPDESKGSGGVS
jgi:transcriptional regulator with XRE-family HTH domain